MRGHQMVTFWSPFNFCSKKGAQNQKSGQIIYFAKTTQTLDITAIKKPQSIDWGFWNMVGII